MRLRLLISLSLLLFSWQTVWAQLAPANDFFNSGAQSYISNNIPNALSEVETGLKFYPDDIKLKKLEKLLKQQQSQSSQSQQSQQNQSQQQKSGGQQNQQQSQKKQSSQGQDQQNQSDQKKGEEQKYQQGQKPSDKNKNGDEKDDQNAQGQPVAAGQMTPEEAKQLLDAQKGDEQFLQPKPQGKPEQNHPAIKDW